MAGVARTLDLTDFISEMEWTANRANTVSHQKPLKQARVLIVASAKENFAGAHSPDGTAWKPLAHARNNSKGGDKPLRDKGLLMASVTSTAGARGNVSELTDTYLVQGTNLEYAAIHQHGGTITPKSAKMLAIPLTREADRAGYARDFPRPLFILTSKGGSLFLAEADKRKAKKGSSRPPILHYVLKDRVVIPARPFLGFGQKLVAGILEIFRDFWADVIHGKGRQGG